MGRFTIIDMETLTTANVGRHELGIADVGKFKAISMARYLLRKFPHMQSVFGIPKRWEEAVHDRASLFSESNLIVSAMGSWQAEGSLNKYLREQYEDIPVVFGWVEPFAAAGHALLINKKTGCFACGTDRLGTPQLRVSRWPKNLLRQEPACGAMFQPYGPIELAQINAHIAQISIDTLLDRVEADRSHRIWCANTDLVKSNGGSWSEDWEKIAGSRLSGGFSEHLSWPHNPDCWVCGKGRK
ncbi:MAG: ThiF family adenylyltransferase [Roseibium sp.]|uniref:ThiF family adenylyltransferase n=1 Tax=Roseibium sp. TaxID=1936156 RepID=UPI003D9C388C